VKSRQDGPCASGAQRSVLAFLRTRPIAAAAVAAGLMFVVVHGSQRVQTGPRERWPEYVVLGVTLYAALCFVFSFRYRALAGAQPELTRMALALAPAVAASGIGALGGPSWAAWSGLLACYLLLVAFAATGRRSSRRHGPDRNAHLPEGFGQSH